MGGGGIIIIRRIAETPGVSAEDQQTLANIEQRSPAGCSFADAVQVMLIVWRLLRP